MINKAIILAAGNGKRMEESSPSVEKEIPKPLRRLLGIPIVEWTVRRMKDLEMDIYIVIRSDDEQRFREVLDKYDVKYIFDNQPFGTAHALYSAKDIIHDDLFLVVMGDDISNICKENLVDSPSVFVHEIDNISAFGSVMVKNAGFVINIKEKESHGKGLANTGIYIMPRSFFDFYPRVKARENGEYYITDVLTEMIAENIPIRALPIGYWKPINKYEDLLKVNYELSKFNYTELSIRTAKKEDFHDLLELISELSRTSAIDLSKGYDPKQSFFNILSNENEIILVVSYKSKIISSAMLIIQDNISYGGRPYCHIENVVTDYDYRNKGITLLNLDFLITYAATLSCYKVILDCKPELVNFYGKIGFAPNGEIEMRIDL